MEPVVQTWAGTGDTFTSGCPYGDNPITGNRPYPLPGVSGQPAPPCATTTHPHCSRAREAVLGPEHCQGQDSATAPRTTPHGTGGISPSHCTQGPQVLTAASLPPTRPSLGAELPAGHPGLPCHPRKDTGCGEGVVGVRCRVLTCETPESPSGWTSSPPGSAEGPAHSALSSSSGTRGLWRDKAAALKGRMSPAPLCRQLCPPAPSHTPLPTAVAPSSRSARWEGTGQGWHWAGAAPPQNATPKGAAAGMGMSAPERMSWAAASGATRPTQVTGGQLQSGNPKALLPFSMGLCRCSCPGRTSPNLAPRPQGPGGAPQQHHSAWSRQEPRRCQGVVQAEAPTPARGEVAASAEGWSSQWD